MHLELGGWTDCIWVFYLALLALLLPGSLTIAKVVVVYQLRMPFGLGFLDYQALAAWSTDIYVLFCIPSIAISVCIPRSAYTFLWARPGILWGTHVPDRLD